MARELNIYHNLITNEDKLTELLANLLQFSAVKEAFTELLADKLKWPDLSFHYRNVDTQKNLAGLGRPDLVIENKLLCIFIECKTDDYRELTSNQPGGYLQYLDAQTDKQCALIFLLPYYYEHEALIHKGAISSKTQLEIIYWTDLLDKLEQVNMADQDVAIKHFVDLLRTWFKVKETQFSEEDMKLLQNREFPTQLLKVLELITEVSNKFPKSFKTEQYWDEASFGYYVIDQERAYVLWFGCAVDFWRDHGSFFQIGLGDDGDFDRAVIARFKDKLGQDAIWYEPWEWYLSPIPLERIEHRQNVKQLVEYIAEVAGHCSGAETQP